MEVSCTFSAHLTIEINDYTLLEKNFKTEDKLSAYIKKYGESATYQPILRSSVVPLRKNGSFKFFQDLCFPNLTQRKDSAEKVIGSNSTLAKTLWAIMSLALDIFTLIPRLYNAGMGNITDINKHPLLTELEQKKVDVDNANLFQMTVTYERKEEDIVYTDYADGVESRLKIDKVREKGFATIFINTDGLIEKKLPVFKKTSIIPRSGYTEEEKREWELSSSDPLEDQVDSWFKA